MNNKSKGKYLGTIFFIGWLIVLLFIIQSSASQGNKLFVGSLMVAMLIIYSQTITWIDEKETSERIRAESKKAMRGFKKQ